MYTANMIARNWNDVFRYVERNEVFIQAENFHADIPYTSTLFLRKLVFALRKGYFEGMFFIVENETVGDKYLEAISTCLAKGTGPRNFSLIFRNTKINYRSIVILSNGLMTGNFPPYFALTLSYQPLSSSSISQLTLALRSGKCPEGLILNLRRCLYEKNEKEILDCYKSFMDALLSGNCPTNFGLDMSNNQIPDIAFELLAKALASGKCPKGLMLNISSNYSSYKGIRLLAAALEIGKFPKNLTLVLPRLDGGNSMLALHILMKAICSGGCSTGLTLCFHDNITSRFATILRTYLTDLRCARNLTLCFTSPNVKDNVIKVLINAGRFAPELQLAFINQHSNLISALQQKIIHDKIFHEIYLMVLLVQACRNTSANSCDIPSEIIISICEFLFTHKFNQVNTLTIFNKVMSFPYSNANANANVNTVQKDDFKNINKKTLLKVRADIFQKRSWLHHSFFQNKRSTQFPASTEKIINLIDEAERLNPQSLLFWAKTTNKVDEILDAEIWNNNESAETVSFYQALRTKYFS